MTLNAWLLFASTETVHGYMAARAAALAREPRFLRATNRICGGTLAVASMGVALGTER